MKNLLLLVMLLLTSSTLLSFTHNHKDIETIKVYNPDLKATLVLSKNQTGKYGFICEREDRECVVIIKIYNNEKMIYKGVHEYIDGYIIVNDAFEDNIDITDDWEIIIY
jgi:hypothetical protein